LHHFHSRFQSSLWGGFGKPAASIRECALSEAIGTELTTFALQRFGRQVVRQLRDGRETLGEVVPIAAETTTR
jgi:hypothetical protein